MCMDQAIKVSNDFSSEKAGPIFTFGGSNYPLSFKTVEVNILKKYFIKCYLLSIFFHSFGLLHV